MCSGEYEIAAGLNLEAAAEALKGLETLDIEVTDIDR